MSVLRALLEEGVDRGLFAGAAAAVAGPEGLLLEESAGEARVEPAAERAPATPRTLWDLGALTRPLAGAALALSLARDRALSLADPVGRFHDLWKRTRFDGVTLRRILLHQAGLAGWFPCYVRGEGRAAYARALSEVDPEGPPGREVLVSDVGFMMLAEALERASAAPLGALFRERVARPLGLEKDLLFAPEGEDRARAAGGERDDATERRGVEARRLRYAGFRSGVVNGEVNDGNAYRRAGGLSVNAGLFGTARAVADAGRAWMPGDARFLHEEDAREATGNGTPGCQEERGLGWRVEAGCFGESSTSGASLLVDPGRRRVSALLTNRLHPDARGGDWDAFRSRFHALVKEI